MTFSDLESSLLTLWDDTAQLWQGEILGVNIGLLAGGMAVLIVCLILPSILARVISRTVVTVADDGRALHYRRLLNAVKAPLRLLPPIIGALIAHQYLEPDTTLRWAMGNLARSLLVVMLFWALYRAVDPFVQLSTGLRQRLSGPLVDWLAKSAKVVLVFLGATAVLEVWGVNVVGLLAGLGLVGVAVALGAQDLFKNLISGILILAERRFENGDWIEVDGVIEGTVMQIGFRSTSIRRFDLSPVYVPNTKLSDNALTNFSRMPQRRIYWSIAVEYRTSIDQLREIRDGIEAYLTGNDEFVQPDRGTLFVRVNDFSDSAIEILIYCFTNTTDWGEWLEIRERFAYRIKEVVEGAGAGFAFPSRSLYIEKDDSVDGRPGDEDSPDGEKGDRSRPERYTPPSGSGGRRQRERPGTTSTEQNEAGGEEEGE
ncbi:mechanosensitive ion channel family protein [Thalassobaculum sp. OXR-137]|uniref:mechanosensitive ion channel family protein n=1 Tax=Thalassobaculum sp. OXR-137 TaxID=3100173 RepID=UPI002AC98F87|nr:mechanosensitive ion channel family protein [Thalassobaculum sp. OXR-137]WPZ32952.1 mechanosensitive ion channel family protein [Thalassobaculum sp. OXR-137]